MEKSVFPTKVKDGLFILAAALVIMGGSLYVDAVKGVLHGERVRVSIYLEGTAVEEALEEGNMVTAYRRAVGKIDRVSFFAAEVVREAAPSGEIAKANLDELAGTPEQIARLKALRQEMSSRREIVTGMKLDCLIYKDAMGSTMPLFGPRSEARIAAAGMLGEPLLQIFPSSAGGGLKEGDRLGFPKNDVPGPAGKELPVFGTELVTAEDVRQAQERIAAQQATGKVRQAEFEKILEQIAASLTASPASEPRPLSPSASAVPPSAAGPPAGPTAPVTPAVPAGQSRTQAASSDLDDLDGMPPTASSAVQQQR